MVGIWEFSLPLYGYYWYSHMIPIQDIMATMLRQHGKFRSEHITIEAKLIKGLWNPTTPVQTLLNQISKEVDLVEAAEEPFSDKYFLLYRYDAVHGTGVFTDSVKVWRRKSITAKKWTAFKTYMIDKYNNYLEDQASDEQHP